MSNDCFLGNVNENGFEQLRITVLYIRGYIRLQRSVEHATWYEKLAEYFPVEEMKSEEHMKLLLKEKGDIYHKDESNKHVLMYVETEDFVFVDYLFVSGSARGEGLGKKLIEQLKKKEQADYTGSRAG